MKDLYPPPFRLETSTNCLWRGSERVQLTPKDCAVLHYLVTHPGQLVTHGELFRALWPGIVVSHGVLKVCMSRIRRALNDIATAPQIIETVHRRGYRFIAPGSVSLQEGSGSRFYLAPQAAEYAWERVAV